MSNHLEFQQYAVPTSRAEQSQAMYASSGEDRLLYQNKRKATTELGVDDHSQQNFQISNKRAAESRFSPKSLNMPQLATPNKRTPEVYSMLPKTSFPSKKMTQKESASKSHPVALGNENMPSEVSAEKLDPVRAKLRESLCSALALVSENKAGVSNADKTENLAAVSASEGESKPGDPLVNDENDNDKKLGEDGYDSSSKYPSEKCNSVENDSQEVQIGEAWKFVGQDFNSNPVFPGEDAPFCDGFFFRDELLQGNGLSWAMDLDAHIAEIQAVESADKDQLPHGDTEEQENEQADLSPESVACRIESELFTLFGGVNKKYKEKGRSLLFNLKDRNNPELREKVMSGEIPPERLCTMTAEELASKELSEWRTAKAEELDQMKVLPNSDANMRRLVKKTHKGEYQVDFDHDVSVVEDVPVDTYVVHGSGRKKTSGGSTTDSSKGGEAKENRDDQCKITISGDGTDIHGLMADDMHIRDLPPIMSLDEFMESLDKEPPFESLSDDRGRRTPEGDEAICETGAELKSSVQHNADGDTESKSPLLPSENLIVSSSHKSEEVNVKSPQYNADGGTESKSPVLLSQNPAVTTSESNETGDIKGTLHNAEMKSSESRTAADMAKQIKVQHFWKGLLQLTLSSTAYVTAMYKSGEKASARDWPSSFEIKGRVRLDAFDKFLQELPKSRTRAMMVAHFALMEQCTDEEHSNLSELINSYIKDQRLGYAEPAPGVEIYMCPPRSKTVGMIVKHLPKGYTEELSDIDNGLIGILVWRKERSTSAILPKPLTQQKPIIKGQHFTSGRQLPEKAINGDIGVASKPAPHAPILSTPSSNKTNDEEDDAPPGFGPPGGSGDDDDLPEFNFSGGTKSARFPASGLNTAPAVSHIRPNAPPQQVDKLRELIQKYGQSGNNPVNAIPIQPWNDDDDDIPEWQPHALHQHQQLQPPQTLPAQKSVPTPRMLSQQSFQPQLVPLAKPMQPHQPHVTHPLQPNMIMQGVRWHSGPNTMPPTGDPRVEARHIVTQPHGRSGAGCQSGDKRSSNAFRRSRGF